MKNEFYKELLTQAKGLMSGESDLIANMANLSALMFNRMEKVNWAGFYLYKEDQLVLGPFQGQPAYAFRWGAVYAALRHKACKPNW